MLVLAVGSQGHLLMPAKVVEVLVQADVWHGQVEASGGVVNGLGPLDAGAHLVLAVVVPAWRLGLEQLSHC